MPLLQSSHLIQAYIKVGEKRISPSGKLYPGSLDYFIATIPCGGKQEAQAKRHPELTAFLQTKYGTDKPKTLDIVLVDHHPDECFFSSFAFYKAGKCVCRGDESKGKAQRVKFGKDAKGNTVILGREEVVCDHENCTFHGGNCKGEGKLTFIIPDAPLAGGVLQLVTKGLVGIGKINEMLRNIFIHTGTLKGLPMQLKVRMMETAQGNVPSVYVEPPTGISWNDLRTISSQRYFGSLEEMKREFTLGGSKPNQDTLAEFNTLAEEGDVLDGEVLPTLANTQRAAEPVTPAAAPAAPAVAQKPATPKVTGPIDPNDVTF